MINKLNCNKGTRNYSKLRSLSLDDLCQKSKSLLSSINFDFCPGLSFFPIANKKVNIKHQ